MVTFYYGFVMIDLFFSWSTIIVHTFLLWMIIWRETSFMLRWLSTMLIARIFCDYVLMTPMDATAYFYLYYGFEIVGFFLFMLAYIECKRLIVKSQIGLSMLIYMIPEAIHVAMFLTHRWNVAVRFADVLRPVYLSCMIYLCFILYGRKGYHIVND